MLTVFHNQGRQILLDCTVQHHRRQTRTMFWILHQCPVFSTCCESRYVFDFVYVVVAFPLRLIAGNNYCFFIIHRRLMNAETHKLWQDCCTRTVKPGNGKANCALLWLSVHGYENVPCRAVPCTSGSVPLERAATETGL